MRARICVCVFLCDSGVCACVCTRPCVSLCVRAWACACVRACQRGVCACTPLPPPVPFHRASPALFRGASRLAWAPKTFWGPGEQTASTAPAQQPLAAVFLSVPLTREHVASCSVHVHTLHESPPHLGREAGTPPPRAARGGGRVSEPNGSRRPLNGIEAVNVKPARALRRRCPACGGWRSASSSFHRLPCVPRPPSPLAGRAGGGGGGYTLRSGEPPPGSPEPSPSVCFRKDRILGC